MLGDGIKNRFTCSTVSLERIARRLPDGGGTAMCYIIERVFRHKLFIPPSTLSALWFSGDSYMQLLR